MIDREAFKDADICEREFLATPPAEPVVRSLWDYWDGLRDGCVGPPRGLIDPAQIAKHLSQLLILDFEPGNPVRFRYRLSGTQADGIHGHALTGAYVDTLHPPSFSALLQADLEKIVTTGAPQYVRLNFINSVGNSRGYNVLRMPLSENGIDVDRVLVFTNFRF